MISSFVSVHPSELTGSSSVSHKAPFTKPYGSPSCQPDGDTRCREGRREGGRERERHRGWEREGWWEAYKERRTEMKADRKR